MNPVAPNRRRTRIKIICMEPKRIEGDEQPGEQRIHQIPTLAQKFAESELAAAIADPSCSTLASEEA